MEATFVVRPLISVGPCLVREESDFLFFLIHRLLWNNWFGPLISQQSKQFRKPGGAVEAGGGEEWLVEEEESIDDEETDFGAS
nr:hypothetical protein Iba_chr09bCG11260 [Ipomoea batatas]